MRINEKAGEHECAICDGTGLMPSTGPWQLNICKSCNGRGVILYDKYSKKVVAYDVEATVATKKAIIDGKHSA